MIQLLQKYGFGYILIILIYFLTTGIVLRVFYPLQYDDTTFFISDLFNMPIYIPQFLIQLSSFANVILFFLLGNTFFKGWARFVPSIIYSSSFWTGYLAAGNSVWLYLLFLFLVLFYSLSVSATNLKRANLLFIGSSAAIVLSSLLASTTLLAFMALLFILRPVYLIRLRLSLVVLAIVFALVLVLSFRNYPSLINLFNNSFTITSDIGIINYVNDLRGQPDTQIDRLINRITENRYVYISSFLIYKFIGNLVPAVYFTAQEKLLNFSFSPPLMVGFLIPFFYGLYKLIITNKLKFLIAAVSLVLPSFLGLAWVDLNRLFLIFPGIIYLITIGFTGLTEKGKRAKIILYFALLLIALQYLVVISDINIRDIHRAADLFSKVSFSLGRQ